MSSNVSRRPINDDSTFELSNNYDKIIRPPWQKVLIRILKVVNVSELFGLQTEPSKKYRTHEIWKLDFRDAFPFPEPTKLPTTIFQERLAAIFLTAPSGYPYHPCFPLHQIKIFDFRSRARWSPKVLKINQPNLKDQVNLDFFFLTRENVSIPGEKVFDYLFDLKSIRMR